LDDSVLLKHSDDVKKIRRRIEDHMRKNMTEIEIMSLANILKVRTDTEKNTENAIIK